MDVDFTFKILFCIIICHDLKNRGDSRFFHSVAVEAEIVAPFTLKLDLFSHFIVINETVRQKPPDRVYQEVRWLDIDLLSLVIHLSEQLPSQWGQSVTSWSKSGWLQSCGSHNIYRSDTSESVCSTLTSIMSQSPHHHLSRQQHSENCLHTHFNVSILGFIQYRGCIGPRSVCVAGIKQCSTCCSYRIDLTPSFNGLFLYHKVNCILLLCSLGKFYSPDNELPATFDLYWVIVPSGLTRPWTRLTLLCSGRNTGRSSLTCSIHCTNRFT